jgi:hypothetical protein
MDAIKLQIHALQELGHTPAEIADALDLDLAAVRLAAGHAGADDKADMIMVLRGIALNRSERTADRIRAATYVHEEAHGRNEKRAAASVQVEGIMELSMRLQNVRQRALPAKARTILDITPPSDHAPLVEKELVSNE